MLGNIGTVELMLILLAVLLIFGSKRIPEIARGLGQASREFRAAMREISSEIQVEDRELRRATNLRTPAARPPSPPRQEPDASAGPPATPTDVHV